MKARLVSILALLIACCYVASAQEHPNFPAYKVVNVTNGGTITGIVKYEGDAPKMKKLEVTKDQNVCGKTEKYDESLMVGPGNGLKNAIVYLLDISSGADFPKMDAQGKPMAYEINQEGCQFKPHVLALPAGERLTMLNSDGIMHNVHLFSTVNQPFNQAQQGIRKRMPLPTSVVQKPEVPLKVGCDVHGWMGAWIVVFPHPYYAVTNEKGEYKIANVPPGTYKVAYWQEACGTNMKTPASVTVAAGGTVKQDFALKLTK